MLIAAVVAVAIFASAIITSVTNIGSAISTDLRMENTRIRTNIIIEYLVYDNNTSTFIVFMKNVGGVKISFEELTVFFGTYGHADIYFPSDVLIPGSKTWVVEELDTKNNVWDIGETIKMYLTNSTTVDPPYYIRIVTLSGKYFEKIFSPPIP